MKRITFKNILIAVLVAGVMFGASRVFSDATTTVGDHDGLHYYGLLSDEEKKEYEIIEKALLNEQGWVFSSTSVPKTVEGEGKVIKYVLMDHPEIMSYDGDMSYRNLLIAYRYDIGYTKLDENRAFAVADDIINTVQGMSEYEQVKYVYNYLASTVSYRNDGHLDRTMYGALVDKVACCEGIADAFSYILTKLNIENYEVSGVVDGIGHRWNAVRVNDVWYEFDIVGDLGGSWNYFMVNRAH